jgi:quinolinate synthase
LFYKSLKCIQSPPPDSNPVKPNQPRNPSSPFACSAVTFSPSQTTHLVSSKLRSLVSEFQSLSEPIDRVKRLLHYATILPPMDDAARVDSNRVMGCTARVWLQARLDQNGKVRFVADSDSEITKGFCSCLVWVLDGAAPEEVMKVTTEDLADLNVGVPGRERSRVNTWHNVLVTMQKRTRALVAERDGKVPPFEPFPSLVVTADGVEPKGSYAEAQVCGNSCLVLFACGFFVWMWIMWS